MDAILFPETFITNPPYPIPFPPSKPVIQSNPQKSFVEALGNVCNTPTSQLPIPCSKGDKLAISILEDETF